MLPMSPDPVERLKEPKRRTQDSWSTCAQVQKSQRFLLRNWLWTLLQPWSPSSTVSVYPTGASNSLQLLHSSFMWAWIHIFPLRLRARCLRDVWTSGKKREFQPFQESRCCKVNIQNQEPECKKCPWRPHDRDCRVKTRLAGCTHKIRTSQKAL